MTSIETRHRLAIAGRVVDGRSGKPVAGARVELATAPAALRKRLALLDTLEAAAPRRPDRTVSDASGRFAFVDLPPGTYSLVATAPGAGIRFGSGKARARVVKGAKGTITPALVEIAVPPTTVAVRVTAGGTAIAQARARLQGSGETAVTRGDGTCELMPVEPGSRTVIVEAAGYQPARQTVELAQAGATATVAIALDPVS